MREIQRCGAIPYMILSHCLPPSRVTCTVPVVRADVDQSQFERRFGNRRDRLIRNISLLVRIIARQVGRDLFELVAAVPRAEQEVHPVVENAWIVG